LTALFQFYISFF